MCFISGSNISAFAGKSVTVHIKHKTYGEQKIRGIIKIIDDGKRLGICIGGHEIFLFTNEINRVELNKNGFCINGDLMTIQVDK